MNTITKEPVFAKTNSSSDDSFLETQISAALWQWRFADAADRDKTIADSRLALMLEFWMPFSDIEYTRKLGTWCDGIPLLTVADINRTAFIVAGVGYFPINVSPFELGFYYKCRRDLHPERIEFRFGMLDRGGGLQIFGPNQDPNTILMRRPIDVRDWAVAVELTASDSE